MRNTTPSFEAAVLNPKVAKARATFRKTLPVFDVVAVNESLGLPAQTRIDCDAYGSDILRVATFNGYLHVQHITDLEDWPEWVDTGRRLYVEPLPGAVCRSNPAVDNGYIWYQSFNGEIMRWNYTSNVTVEVASFPSQVEIAPIGDTAWIMHNITGHRVEIFKLGDEDHTYGIYGDITSLPRFDAVAFDGAYYLYTMDRDAGRVIEIKCTELGGQYCYGVARPIIPIDAIDDDYGLVLGGAGLINGNVVVTGRMTRTSDGIPVIMDIYSIGPENFTLGFEMYIQSSEIINGKMILMGSDLVVSGVGHYAIADATILFGLDYGRLETAEFSHFSLVEEEGRSTALAMELSTELASEENISPGAEVVLEFTYDDGVNEDWVKLTTCDIIEVTNGRSEVGDDASLNAFGKSTLRLGRWSPDQGIYVPSQAYTCANPKDLSQFVRGSGTWEDAGFVPEELLGGGAQPVATNYGVQLREFNKVGVLYTAERSSRGGTMRARFTFPADDVFSTFHGVAINYYLESLQEASERLGKTLCATTKDDCGHNGIVAAYRNFAPDAPVSSDDPGYPFIGLYLWTDNEFTLLAEAPMTIPFDCLHWIEIQFIEGDIQVRYRDDDSWSWTDVLTYKYAEDRLPWKRETFGRGAVVMKNVSASMGGYALSSTDTIVAVDDVDAFAGNGTIMLDGEVCTYTGKSAYNTQKPSSDGGYQVKHSKAFKLDNDFTSGSRVVVHTKNEDDEAHGKPDDYFKGAAAVVRGYGRGHTYEVVGYDAILPDVWVPKKIYHGWSEHIGVNGHGHWGKCNADTLRKGFYLSPDASGVVISDGDIGDVRPNSNLLIKPALTGLVRSGTATAHEDGAISLYTDAHVYCDRAEYFSQDEDLSLGEALVSVVRHSGGKAEIASVMDEVSSGYTGIPGLHANFIATFELPELAFGEYVGVCFRSDYDLSGKVELASAPASSCGYRIRWSHIGDDTYHLELHDAKDKWEGNWQILSQTTFSGKLSGTCKISVHDNAFSVWLNGRLVQSFYDDRYDEYPYAAFCSNVPFSVYISELDDLLPDIVVGVRGNGMSVVSELISDRHVKFREDENGVLKFYRSRPMLVTVPDIVIAKSRTVTNDYITRIRAEGVEMCELIDVENIRLHGNVFSTMNVKYANTLKEAETEAVLIMKEIRQKADTTAFALIPYPALQPGDGAVIDGQQVYVTGQSMAMGFSGDKFDIEMKVECMSGEQ